MDILIVSKKLGRRVTLSLKQKRVISGALVALVGLPLMSGVTAYYLGYQAASATPDDLRLAYKEEVGKQRQEILEAKQEAEENLNALTLRLGEMQAHVTRLNAMGRRLTQVAGLEQGEFDFDTTPALGGPEARGSDQSSIAVGDFVAQLESLTHEIENREEQMNILEGVLMARSVQKDTFPSGRPLHKGWISSRFGKRTDPFTGKLDYHEGIDIAAKEGTEIIAVASGVVTWSGRRYGYGNLVEVTHGNGYVTRYGHNKENLVEVGQTVKKGQVLAKMGNTGRSTGPHVHFEVRRNGRTVDPMRYVRAEH